MQAIEEKTKNNYSHNSMYNVEFHKNGICYLDTFYIARSIFFGEKFATETKEGKDNRIQFCKSFTGSWN